MGKESKISGAGGEAAGPAPKAKKPGGPKGKPKGETKRAALQFLEYYYPIHYKAGIALEDALRGGTLSRHQVAILWLIHSEGREGRAMNRKAIERSLSAWFEISGAAITKALRAMAQPPLALVRLEEDPRSGREKIVTLTAKGETHLEKMIASGEAYVQRIIDNMSEEEIVQGLHFFRRISEIVDTLR